MKEAAELLATTKLSVAEATEQVGYMNQSKFASVFKKEFGKQVRLKPGFTACQRNPGLTYA